MRAMAALGMVLLAGCGGEERSPTQVTGNAGGGHGGSVATAGSSGEHLASAGSISAVGGSDGTSAGRAGSSAKPDAGESNPGAGGELASSSGGAPSSDSGAPGSGGQANSDGGAAPGEGGGAGETQPPTGCDCDAAHDCVNGACVLKPACDCAALGVECSPLHAALGEAFACPIDVQCGSCGPGELCMLGVSKPRVCGHCDDAANTNPAYNPAPTCPVDGYPPECSVAYSFCGTVVLTGSGEMCPVPNSSRPEVSWRCGPEL